MACLMIACRRWTVSASEAAVWTVRRCRAPWSHRPRDTKSERVPGEMDHALLHHRELTRRCDRHDEVF